MGGNFHPVMSHENSWIHLWTHPKNRRVGFFGRITMPVEDCGRSIKWNFMRDRLESSILRHGDVKDLSAAIERGEKPPYADFVDFMEGKTDPEVDTETTTELIRKKIAEGQMDKEDFDVIITSPAKRAQGTAETVNQVLGTDAAIRTSEYLKEVNLPMGSVTPEFYQGAKNINEVRKRALEAFLGGDKLDEDAVDAYRRAERFLVYERRIRKQTAKKPLFITHGIFLRILDLAMKHQEEELSDDQIRTMVKEEFAGTKRPGTFEGIRIESTEEGIKSVGIV